jgi:hypothetical protein
MIPLFFAALVDTVVAPGDYETVHIHEWGVVLFSEDGADVTGVYDSPDDFYIDGYDYGHYCVEAPVVWFHGTPCSGTFTVRTPEGWLTELYPVPDDIGSVAPELPVRPAEASWYFTVGGAEPSSERMREWDSSGLSWGWAAGYWRNVPAEYLYRESDGFCDRFIYYECGLPLQWNEIFTGVDEGIVFRDGFTGEGIVFVSGSMPGYAMVSIEDELIVPPMEEFVPAGPDSMKAILGRWAEWKLKPEEIDALWYTWESAMYTLPGTWLLFPIPAEDVNRISTIEFIPDDCFVGVRYQRLFLGLVRIDS